MKCARYNRLMGFDSGFRNAGAIIFSSSGVPLHSSLFQTKQEKRTKNKVWEQNYSFCLSHFAWLKGLITDWHVGTVAVELQTGSSQSQKALRAMSLSFASTVTALTALGVRIIPVEPLQIKRLTSTTQDKSQIITWAEADPQLKSLLTGVKGKDEHLADAAAAAVVGGLYEYLGK